jgi:hypothetical protein
MIFQRSYDKRYYRWFAWRPVILDGPDEWDRCKRLHVRRRLVWLRFIWRMRMKHTTYRALPGAQTDNAMLLDAVFNQ